MSSGVKGGVPAGGRVSIPSSVRKTIENIKEITGPNHGEDEIYAMLKECSMDPNETAQKLLLLDTFHEVKKKRDRRKENLNKEPAESRWNPGSQARVSRPGRGNYSSRHVSHDAGGRHALTVKHSSTSQISQKVVREAPLANAQEMKNKEASSSESTSGVISQVTNSIHENHVSASGGNNQYNDTGNTSKTKLDGSLLFSSSVDSSKNPDAVGTSDIMQNEMLDSSNSALSLTSTPASGSHFSSLDPILLPSQDVPLPIAVGTLVREMGSKDAPVKVIADNATERKSASGVQQVPNDFQGVGKTQNVESVQTPPSTTGSSSVSRPSSNYNNRSQVVGPQKAGPGKEWKPKSTTPSVDQGACTAASSEVSNICIASRPESQETPEKATVELQKKLEELHISDSQNVIIPNHLQVPDAGKLGFCFGSFDASFGLDMNEKGALGSEKSLSLLESYEANEEPAKELQLSNQTVLAAAENSETKYHEHTQSLAQGPKDFSSGDVEISSSTTPAYDESKQEVASGSHQHPVVHNSSYHYGFMPPVLSSQLKPFETSESQAHDRLPGFVVQRPFDPASYYKQFYPSSIDSEGGISHLHSAVPANEYNGNAAMLSTQTSQSPEEVAAPPVLSSPSPVPLVTQAAGVMHSSISATQQQPFPIFRNPTGVHLTHYPPFIPYGPYLSPYYVPPAAIHQFLSNGAFQLQHHGGGLYPTPPGTTGKYSVSHHKQGSNTGSSTHIGMPGNYGPYGLSMANYTSSSVTGVTSTSNEDLAAPQGKENNIYLSGQLNENSGVGQGQFAFAPTPPGRGPFTGIFHPPPPPNLHPLLQQSQSITIPIDMVGPTTTVYQQQQQAQLSWPSNF